MAVLEGCYHQLPARREHSCAGFEQMISTRMADCSRISSQTYMRIHRVNKVKSTAALPSFVCLSSSRCQELLDVSLFISGKGQKCLIQPVTKSKVSL